MTTNVTFDNRVAFRRAFSVRREELINEFVRAYGVYGDAGHYNVQHWAKRLEEANDAEHAIASLLLEVQ